MNSEEFTPEDRARVAATGRRMLDIPWALGLAFIAILAIGDATSSIHRRQGTPGDLWWLDALLIGAGVVAAVAAVVILVRWIRRRRPGVMVDRPRLPALDPAVLVATVQRVAETKLPVDYGYRPIPEIHVSVEGTGGAWDAVIGDLLDHPEAQGVVPGTRWKVNAFPKDRHWVALAVAHDDLHRLGYWMPDLVDSEEEHSGGFFVKGHAGHGSDIRFAAEVEA